MRTSNLTKYLVAALALAGCKWTDFDDLEDQSWVESTEKPNANSSDYGVALQRGTLSSDSGGTLVVLGAGQALYNELVYKPAGGAALDSLTEIKLNNQFAIGNLQAQPILIADPSSDDVALVTNSGGDGSIAILAGTHTMVASQVFGPSVPDAAVYMRVASQAAAPKPAQVLVASMDAVYGFAVAPTPQPRCNLTSDGTMPVMVRGLAAMKITSTEFDDLVVWGADGFLYIYDGNVFDGCATPASPIAVPVDVGFVPVQNANMHVVDGKYLVLAGHKMAPDAAARVAVYDVTAMNMTPALEPKLIGAPLDREGLVATTILDAEGMRFLVGGYPLSSVNGTVAGQVLAFPLDLDGATPTGIDPTVAMTLNDAQPESNQAFGRAVVTIPYNGKQVLAVSAANEIFLYYQAPVYGETRRK